MNFSIFYASSLSQISAEHNPFTGYLPLTASLIFFALFQAISQIRRATDNRKEKREVQAASSGEQPQQLS